MKTSQSEGQKESNALLSTRWQAERYADIMRRAKDADDLALEFECLKQISILTGRSD